MFTKDLCISPSTRKEHSVTHAVAAVGSRSLQKAEEFIRDVCPKGAAGQIDGTASFKPKAYGSYKEVVEDPVSLPRASRRICRCSKLWTGRTARDSRIRAMVG